MREWRQTQKRLADHIAEYENAAHDYVQDGVRLLELAKSVFSVQTAKFKRKAEVADFVCSNSSWKDQTLTAASRQPFDVLGLTNDLAKKKGRRNLFQRPLSVWRAILENLRNFFLSPPTEMLSFFQQLQG